MNKITHLHTIGESKKSFLVLPGVFLYHVKHSMSKDRIELDSSIEMILKKKLEGDDSFDPLKMKLFEKFKEELSSMGTITTSRSTAERMYALISSANKASHSILESNNIPL